MLWYNQLPCNFFTDTLISGMASKRGNKYAEVFATDFGWAQAYPIKKKSDTHEALYLLLQCMGVPDKMIIYGSK